MIKFSIIIVTWNGLELLKTFLPSVAETDYPDFEIIIADNASTDGSKEWINNQFPGVKIVTFGKNYGYCGGNNRAVPYASGEILVFLNNDVRVASNWLHPLAQAFNRDKDIAALQPKILSHKKPLAFDYAGAAGGHLDKYGYPFCRGRLFDTVENDMGQYDENQDIFWASGAALAIRKTAFEKSGGFDESFEFHMEEVDLCWRLWNADYKIRSCTESVVYHLGGGSLPRQAPRKLYYNYRNSLKTLWKNYASATLPFRFTVRLYFDFIAALREILSGKVKNFKAIVKAHTHFWSSFTKTNQKRKELQSKRQIHHDPPVLFSKNIVRAYFLSDKKTYSDLMQRKKRINKLLSIEDK